jgi:hypothetical protein
LRDYENKTANRSSFSATNLKKNFGGQLNQENHFSNLNLTEKSSYVHQFLFWILYFGFWIDFINKLPPKNAFQRRLNVLQRALKHLQRRLKHLQGLLKLSESLRNVKLNEVYA